MFRKVLTGRKAESNSEVRAFHRRPIPPFKLTGILPVYGINAPAVAQACQRPSRLIQVSVYRSLRSNGFPFSSFPFVRKIPVAIALSPSIRIFTSVVSTLILILGVGFHVLLNFVVVITVCHGAKLDFFI